MELDEEGRGPPLPKYNEHLSGPLITAVSVGAPKARVHSAEWAKIMAGAPVGTADVCCAPPLPSLTPQTGDRRAGGNQPLRRRRLQGDDGRRVHVALEAVRATGAAQRCAVPCV